MGLAEWRNLICCAAIMVASIIVAPSSLIGQSTDRALLHNNGGTLLNRTPAAPTSAIFPDALIETQKSHLATIDADGSSAIVQPETMVQFEVDELDLDHGYLQMTTSGQMRVRVNCLTVIPITADLTQYDVIDVDGKVKVIATKRDVRIRAKRSSKAKVKQDGTSDVIVKEGHESTRDDRCGAAAKPMEGLAGKGGILNGRPAIIIGAGVIGSLCILLCGSDDPPSPYKP